MDNQDSTPQLIIPNVPDDFCPVGDWRTILQTYQDVVLSNGTVDIPGLSDLSPETIAQLESDVNNLQSDVIAIQGDITTIEGQITTINTNITNLQTDVTALQARPVVTVRTGTVSVPAGAGPHTINVSISPAMPSATYGVSVTPMNSAAVARANMGSFVIDPTQTTSQFTIYAQDAPANTTLRWTTIHTS